MKYNEKLEKYEILHVVGPDEFHTDVNNNAYTNYLASWSIRTTIGLFLNLEEDRQNDILKYLEIKRDELNGWLEKSQKIFIPINTDNIILQFEGFEELKQLDLDFYKQKYGNIQRIDRILEAEGEDVNQYQVNKQADVLMLFYLFSPEDLIRGFQWLSHPLTESSIRQNIDYHLKISTHGSTLSRIVHSWVIARYDLESAWKYFDLALETDVADVQGGTSSEGIHLGAMAGTVDLVQRCFTGIEIVDDILWIRPRLPREVKEVSLLLHFRGHSFEVLIQEKRVKVNVKRSWIKQGKLG